jgi:putative flavoprotein involved in K+ transport
MYTTNTLIIGGGQAGLALSHWLSSLGRDHLVLERGRVAERWRSERWDSLRLLTPNWMTRLPGYSYRGTDPDGFMTAKQVVSFFDRYAGSFDAPVRDHTTVERVWQCGDLFVVTTDDGEFLTRNVVIATGWSDRPAVPATAQRVSRRIHQVAPSDYRNPDDLPEGGVLVVGAAATGVQLAQELHTSGRPVTLAVGRHSRMPRTYRGMDTFWWLDQMGSFDRTIDDVDDPVEARNEPSLQLVGTRHNTNIDLHTLRSIGVRLTGRLVGFDGTRAEFSSGLQSVVDAADRQMGRVLTRIDDGITRRGLDAEVLAPDRPDPVGTVAPTDSLDLWSEGIRSIVWATGFRRAYDWLELPVFDAFGEIAQYRGVTSVPGVYVLGQRFQHYRNSNFIDGVGRDAWDVAQHITRAGLRRDDASVTSTTPQR